VSRQYSRTILEAAAAGAGTSADAIIGYAGGLNPMDVVQGYKAASEEKADRDWRRL
jgi:iron complex transport system substrate-binding protein